MTTDARPANADLAAIRERADAAAQGPWQAHAYRGQADRFLVTSFSGNDIAAVKHYAAPLAATSAVFIAAARTDVPALIARIEELRAVLEPQLADPLRVVNWDDAEFACRFCDEDFTEHWNPNRMDGSHKPECPTRHADRLLGRA